jgi:hypothetical protein
VFGSNGFSLVAGGEICSINFETAKLDRSEEAAGAIGESVVAQLVFARRAVIES